MNKQRKVLITITYNEMGIITDTKAEEVAQPNLQPTCNLLATDTINRQAAIDMCRKPHMRNADCSDFEMEIMMLPSAQPERKKGKWIMEDSIYGTVTCSVCYGVRRDNRINHINFCNCCGADMRGDSV